LPRHRKENVFSRFSPASKRVLRAAEQECRNLNHYYVGVEHLLLALLEQHDPLVEARLTSWGVRAADISAELRRTVGSPDDRAWEGILVTPRVRRVIRLAEAKACDELVEPVHVFDAICDEGRSAAAAIVVRRFARRAAEGA
jgi:ATP-dependent Clp protease ATP-binding subunit ClpA